MSYQSDLASALGAASTINAIVGQRIFADVADGSTAAPYLVYQVISTGGETTHDGNRNLDFPLIQFSCWAAGKAAAIALASSLNTLLDGKTLAGASGLTFQFSNQFGTYEADTKLFGEILEYRASCNRN
jgi:hypothetical protein